MMIRNYTTHHTYILISFIKHMNGILQTIRDLWLSKTIRRKILITLGLLALYRLLVFLPVPFVNIDNLVNGMAQAAGGLEYFTMLLG